MVTLFGLEGEKFVTWRKRSLDKISHSGYYDIHNGLLLLPGEPYWWFGKYDSEFLVGWYRKTENSLIVMGQVVYEQAERGIEFSGSWAFNVAFLAKQGWRILIFPDSLIARMYKARYFCTTSFLRRKLIHKLLTRGNILWGRERWLRREADRGLGMGKLFVFGVTSGFRGLIIFRFSLLQIRGLRINLFVILLMKKPVDGMWISLNNYFGKRIKMRF